MAHAKRTLWQKSRYWLNALLIAAPVYFLVTSLIPAVKPEPWKEQAIGPFSAVPTPADNEPPYQHDGEWVKDFNVKFCDGCVAKIRFAYMSVGTQPAPIPIDGEGLLHGNNQVQQAHTPYPLQLTDQDKLWISVQEWDGTLHHASWALGT